MNEWCIWMRHECIHMIPKSPWSTTIMKWKRINLEAQVSFTGPYSGRNYNCQKVPGVRVSLTRAGRLRFLSRYIKIWVVRGLLTMPRSRVRCFFRLFKEPTYVRWHTMLVADTPLGCRRAVRLIVYVKMVTSIVLFEWWRLCMT